MQSESIYHHPEQECIILKDTSKKFLEYEDTPETMAARAELRAYNELLKQTEITIPELNQPFIDIPGKKHRIYIRPEDTFVRRIYNNGCWDHSGRFYGGFWQRMPSDWRSKIHINGRATIELDFSGLHIVLLYSQEGIDYWQEINRDPYDIGATDWDRWFVKKFLLTAINAPDAKTTFRAMRKAYKEEHGYYPSIKDREFNKLLEKVKERHEPIQHKICSGAGIELMNVDSRITEHIIRYFTNLAIPILTVHDSYIIQEQYSDELRKVMKEAMNEIVGPTTIRIK